MKKTVSIALSILLTFSLTSCGEDNHSSGKKGGSSSIVIPPGGITPSNPSGGDNQGGDNNQGGGDDNPGGGDDNPGGGDEPGGGGDDDSPKPGKPCEVDVCNGNQALTCNSYHIYELVATCENTLVCALKYNSDKSAYRADCFETCSPEDVGNSTKTCQAYEDLHWIAPAVCEQSFDNKNIIVPDNSNPDTITPCKDTCENGSCTKMASDEGEPCNEEDYPMHCSGNALVYCSSSGIVTVHNCAKDEDTTTCAEIRDENTTVPASCIDASQTCTTPNTRSYICDDSLLDVNGKYNLIAYKCVSNADGSLVQMHDSFFSVPQCGQTCDSATGQCCDEETGLCTFEEIEE